ncbi:MAG: alkaline phosphatase family protein [Candidatus Eisenbacteria sp.]|nr:alkaline phosphatase family protein [Candidatus Eisenbacteria bacterium]
MRMGRRTCWIAGLAIFGLGLLVLGPSSGPASAAGGKKVLVLGFDGMDPNLSKRLMEEGKLPNFKRLADGGGFSKLGTSIPPQSPVAWSNFITGQNPGGHGIFDFVARTPENYLPFLSTSVTDKKGTRLLRRGTAFWEILEDHGIWNSVLRVPSNYPPVDMKGPSLSGMGTPDILGTYGTFSFYTTEPQVGGDVEGGKIIEVKMRNNMIESSLVGPRIGEGGDAVKVEAPFTVWVDPEEAVAKIRVGDEEFVLAQGEWSDWKPVEFKVMSKGMEILLSLVGQTSSLHSIARFYLKEAHPEFNLYVSPLNFDPFYSPPGTSICTPDGYSKKLAKEIGYFYTQGMAEDTWALNEGRLNEKEFLQQSEFVLQERIRMFRCELEHFLQKEQALYFCYFSTTDPLSHMFGRFMDPGHPLNYPDEFEKYGDVIPHYYTRMDSVLGYALDRVGEGTTVMVLSDHGFTSYRRSFHLNTWLYENGYIQLRDKRKKSSGEFFVNVDWRKTRAYALGINCLYLNLKGREGYGIVKPGYEADQLLAELVEKLEAITDPKTGEQAILRVYRSSEVYSGDAIESAPDLVVGYNAGYRASWETALGKIPNPEKGFFGDNLKKWSGDHCMAAEIIPGVLFTNKPLRIPDPSLVDLAPTILNEFGIEKTPEMIGRNVFAEGPETGSRVESVMR